jgi:hypothetical protein
MGDFTPTHLNSITDNEETEYPNPFSTEEIDQTIEEDQRQLTNFANSVIRRTHDPHTGRDITALFTFVLLPDTIQDYIFRIVAGLEQPGVIFTCNSQQEVHQTSCVQGNLTVLYVFKEALDWGSDGTRTTNKTLLNTVSILERVIHAAFQYLNDTTILPRNRLIREFGQTIRLPFPNLHASNVRPRTISPQEDTAAPPDRINSASNETNE